MEKLTFSKLLNITLFDNLWPSIKLPFIDFMSDGRFCISMKLFSLCDLV